MKKALSVLILTSLIAGGLFVLVSSVQAQGGLPDNCTTTRNYGISGCPATADPTQCPFSTANCGICCLLETLYNVTDWIFVVLVAVAGIFVILGAMTLLMAAGNPEKVTSGRNYILYAAIGLIVAFLARAIPAIVKSVVGT